MKKDLPKSSGKVLLTTYVANKAENENFHICTDDFAVKATPLKENQFLILIIYFSSIVVNVNAYNLL